MTRDELNNAYFDWMYQLVCDDEYSRGLSYRKLLYLLHDTDFTFTMPLIAIVMTMESIFGTDSEMSRDIGIV